MFFGSFSFCLMVFSLYCLRIQKLLKSCKKSKKINELVEFHSMNKFLLMAHDLEQFQILERIVSNYNIFSHTDPFQGNAGGIGFNGSTGDFVAKFFSDTGVYINQVSVDFSSTGRGFRVGIWDDDGTGGQRRGDRRRG